MVDESDEQLEDFKADEVPEPEAEKAPVTDATAQGDTTVKNQEAKPAKKKKAAKKGKAEAAPKANGNGAGRPSPYAGKKLFKVSEEPGLREGSQRMEAYKSITNGMKFETYAEKGGSISVLAKLIVMNKIEAK